MNYTIGFMSFLVISSIFIVPLVSEKVEAMKCLGPCEFYNCKVECKKRGYRAGECVGWNQPDMCCCIPKLYN
ncbi:hypothetical protein Bca4012_091286 [Brassica carinata]|uniref:Knottin scorpion toxin-like domain-containing protein n=2 Tax=Brassica oleracea TaxID=3712 RepID=A0A0D3AF81_BRAOL|nr:unnamed protein product [Brassica oleracea]